MFKPLSSPLRYRYHSDADFMMQEMARGSETDFSRIFGAEINLRIVSGSVTDVCEHACCIKTVQNSMPIAKLKNKYIKKHSSHAIQT